MTTYCDTNDQSEILRRLSQGLKASGDAVALFTPEDRLYYASRSFLELYHITPEGSLSFSDIIRNCFHQAIGPKIDTEDIEAWLRQANAKRRSQGNRRFEIDFLDGRWMWASETTFADGWVFLNVTDFTHVKHKEFSLTDARDAALVAAETDFLTGMLNRGGMMKRLDSLIEASRLSGDPLSIALLDLDHFKTINDRFGHDTGDAVLQHFATCARDIIRDRDALGRIGGEEFLLVMGNATETQAFSVLQRLQQAVRTRPFVNGNVRIAYTLSGGITQWHRSQSLEDIYSAADQALYRAKSEGRDRLKCA